ncbi:MAG: OmpH family outer membrane protein [Chitinophagaceae bacterium]|nr:OmpH family outer membrane protein [Chitinophagaceae bacterium]
MIKKISIFFACIVISTSVYPQQLAIKIGYVSIEYVLSQMPEAKQIESELKAYKSQLENRLESKVKEFQSKGQDFQTNYQKMTELERSDKQEELQNLQASIEKFQREAQTSLQEKEVQLLQPAYDKIQKSIDAIAKENAYTYILRAEALLYGDKETDVSKLVLKNMGITPTTEPIKKNSTNTLPKPPDLKKN